MSKKKKVVSAEEVTFLRSLEAKDEKGNVVITLTAQPYCTGMYFVQNHRQGAIIHKAYWKYSQKLLKELKKDEIPFTFSESKYTDFMSVEDIENYILTP